MRLDQYIVQHHGLTRNKAQQLIITNLVLVNYRVCTKASQSLGENDIITIKEDRRIYWVSRSAEKLAGFLESIDPPILIKGSQCLDIGSSTGGFTQVLLMFGANHIDAVDVGTNQLHESIRQDSRVNSYEKTDIREFAKNNSRNQYDIIVCDVSFISLSEIIDSILSLATGSTRIMLLYKPQFEVGKKNLRHTGVPKNLGIVEQEMNIFENLLISKNIIIRIREKSTLMGEAGNQEWIYMIEKRS